MLWSYSHHSNPVAVKQNYFCYCYKTWNDFSEKSTFYFSGGDLESDSSLPWMTDEELGQAVTFTEVIWLK